MYQVFLESGLMKSVRLCVKYEDRSKSGEVLGIPKSLRIYHCKTSLEMGSYRPILLLLIWIYEPTFSERCFQSHASILPLLVRSLGDKGWSNWLCTTRIQRMWTIFEREMNIAYYLITLVWWTSFPSSYGRTRRWLRTENKNKATGAIQTFQLNEAPRKKPLWFRNQTVGSYTSSLNSSKNIEQVLTILGNWKQKS